MLVICYIVAINCFQKSIKVFNLKASDEEHTQWYIVNNVLQNPFT